MYLKKGEIAYKTECISKETQKLLILTGFERVDSLEEEKKTRRTKKED